MKSKFLFVVALLAVVLRVDAKILEPSDYIYPLQGVSKLYSANFGELRPDHFHSGIDIKTEGVIGKNVVAIADGYISRISVSPYGYGLALYVAHPNGTTSVYAHLSKFSSSVADYVEAERYRTKQNSVNLFCTSKQFPVQQGDIIAQSGNTGGSFGPHLHFEIRDSASQEPINIVAQGVISPRDDIAPLMMKLHYVELDTLQGITRQAPLRSFNLQKDEVGGYKLVGVDSIMVGRKGYFVVEASDRRNDVTNTFGLYRISARVDDRLYFEYQMDRFSYSNTRYCNAIGYYPVMINTRNEALRLASTELTDKSHYTTLENGGVVTCNAGVRRNMNIEVADDSGNVSELRFSIVGKADEDLFLPNEVDEKLIIHAKKPYTYSENGISVNLPARSLYESTVFSAVSSEPTDSTQLSNVYEVLSAAIPLHKSMTISIAASVPYDQQNRVGVVRVSPKGYLSFIPATYRLGSVTASSRTAGKFYVAADVQAPTLSVGIAEGSQQAGSSYFTCKIADDLSGVESYSATLDGEWIAMNLDKGVMRHNFRSKPNGEQHTLVIIATDGAGNQSKITRNFIR